MTVRRYADGTVSGFHRESLAGTNFAQFRQKSLRGGQSSKFAIANSYQYGSAIKLSWDAGKIAELFKKHKEHIVWRLDQAEVQLAASAILDRLKNPQGGSQLNRTWNARVLVGSVDVILEMNENPLLPMLLPLLEVEHPRVLEAAIRAVGEMGDSSLILQLAELRDSRLNVMEPANCALESIVARVDRGHLLKSEDEIIRNETIRATIRLACRNKSFAELVELIDQLRELGFKSEILMKFFLATTFTKEGIMTSIIGNSFIDESDDAIGLEKYLSRLADMLFDANTRDLQYFFCFVGKILNHRFERYRLTALGVLQTAYEKIEVFDPWMRGLTLSIRGGWKSEKRPSPQLEEAEKATAEFLLKVLKKHDDINEFIGALRVDVFDNVPSQKIAEAIIEAGIGTQEEMDFLEKIRSISYQKQHPLPFRTIVADFYKNRDMFYHQVLIGDLSLSPDYVKILAREIKFF